MEFSIAIVGLGLIGSAACRHLSSLTSNPKEIIGIGVPDDDNSGRIFSSHGDQGRLTRIVDPDTVWSQLAAKSIHSYAEIQKKSGINFHGPVGSVRVSPLYGTPGDSLARSLQVGLSNGADAKLVQDKESSFPYFGFLDDDVAVIETGGAGYVNPMDMIKAQLAIARENGVHVVHEIVTKIECIPEGGTRIFTSTGGIFSASRILICAGAYTNFLLPKELQLQVQIEAVSILLAEVDGDEVKRLSDMPSFIWKLKSHPLLHSVYGCPPILYPDGKTYVKIGGTMWKPKIISTQEEFAEWFHGTGSKPETDVLYEVLVRILPGLRVRSLKTKPCVVSYTPPNYPYIDKVNNGVYVAAFGCGASAKSSDEIGKMASLLVFNGVWSYPDLDESLFRSVYVRSKN